MKMLVSLGQQPKSFLNGMPNDGCRFAVNAGQPNQSKSKSYYTVTPTPMTCRTYRILAPRTAVRNLHEIGIPELLSRIP